jgi:hypothetical protein
MAKNRKELDAMLAQLEDNLPNLLKESEESDFIGAFAGEAEVIEDAAGPDDIEHVRGRINGMLGSRGLISSDNEDEPCDYARHPGPHAACA